MPCWSQPKLPQMGLVHLTQLLLAVADLEFLPSQEWLVAFLKVRCRTHARQPAVAPASYLRPNGKGKGGRGGGDKSGFDWQGGRLARPVGLMGV